MYSRHFVLFFFFAFFVCLSKTTATDSTIILIELYLFNQMSLLAKVSEFVDMEVYICFCELKDLQLLDSAYCSSNERPIILKMFTMLGVRDRVVSNRWFALRKVGLELLHLTRKDFEPNLSLKYQFQTSCVRLLYIGERSDRPITSDANLLKIINSCPKLESLQIENIQCLTDAVAMRISPAILSKLLHFCFGNSSEKLTGKSFRYFGVHCKELTGAKIAHQSSKITDSDLISIVANNHKLRTFEESFHGQTYRMLGGQGKTGVMGCVLTEKLISAFAANCPLLERLVLKGLHKYTFASVLNLFRGCPKLQKARFDTMDSFRFDHEEPVDGVGPPLKVLELGGFETIQNEMNGNLVEFFGLQKDFHHLMFFQQRLRDELLLLLAENNPNLNELLLSNCGDESGATFSTVGLKVVLEKCKDLKTLRIGGADVTHISNVEFRALFDVPNGLTCLILQENPNLTTEGAIHILTANPRLEKFDFNKCRGVNIKAVEKHLKQLGRKVDLKGISPCFKGCECNWSL